MNRTPQRYCMSPKPIDDKVHLACQGASLFIDDYLTTLQSSGISISQDDHLFDVMFMCRSGDGWCWAFSQQQHDVLRRRCCKDGPNRMQEHAFDSALQNFKLARAGFIKLLERTENLIVVVKDFKEETYICGKVGYKLESSSRYAQNFEQIEAAIPGLDNSSFFYFRISGHIRNRTTGKKELPQGALVAAFRVANHIVNRISHMSCIRSWVEKWRNQEASFSSVRDVVAEIAKPYQRASATAAIMSRNMSHNLGSHALANSKFFQSVGLLDQSAESATYSKDEAQKARGRLQAFNQYCQGRLDFIARKLSEDGDKPEPLFLLNDVIKGFMTQYVLLDTLLDDNGFRTSNIELHLHGKNQTMSDSGNIRAERMGTIWRYVQPDGANHGELEEFPMDGRSPKLDDILVGIVGGVTGCHAFYALIENLLRNACKYSKPDWHGQPPTLQLHIEIAETKDARGVECYRLRLWENLTDDKDQNNRVSIVQTVRELLAHDLIDLQGKPIKGGHGVQEMKLCAEYLAGGLTFENDTNLSQGKTNLTGSNRDDYIEYLGHTTGLSKTSLAQAPEKSLTVEQSCPVDSTKNMTSMLKSPRLRVFRTRIADNQALVYEMLLPKPVLMGIACVRAGSNGLYGTVCKPEHPSVKRYDKLELLCKDNPHFGLIVAHDCDEMTVRLTLADIAKHHTALPYRLLIVARDDKEQRIWDAAVRRVTADASNNQFYPATPVELKDAIATFKAGKGIVTILPHRRVHVIVSPTDPTIFCGTHNSEHIAKVSLADWERLILAIYEQWIKVWKGDPPAHDKRWKLLIGFQRDASFIDSHWRNKLDEFSLVPQGLLNIYVASSPKSEANNAQPSIRVLATVNHSFKETCSAEDLPAASQDCLVFDNHGDVFGYKHKNESRFWHKFGASEISLFQMLESPPSTPFGFAFFAFSLLESCLTKIVTLDERVADSTISLSSDGRFIDLGREGTLGQMRLADIHPLYSFAWLMNTKADTPLTVTDLEPLMSETTHFITPNIAGPIAFWRILSQSFESVSPILVSEGIRFTRDGTVCQLHEFYVPEQLPRLVPICEPDAIIIHEGITDTLSRDKRWSRCDLLRLYNRLPSVIRTSGRGRQSRELGDNLPFIELNVLSDSCYGSLNKVKIARAVLSASGERTKRE